ncbi:Inactive rhomboid protein 1-like [Oopsacas minuta]|uniref:Inactive rhomboid protein 1-like n=1 Tax=Oopsacas minuta TaxID=111878 RepID=A0AAV7K5A6_9METZ|nr:Inactive rhomboid protein 1-like [Oopsacas minuta]
MSFQMEQSPYNTGGSEIFANNQGEPVSSRYQDERRTTGQRVRQMGRKGTIRAVTSVGDFFGVTQQSQSRLRNEYGERGVSTLRRRHGTQQNNSYVDTNYMSPEFLGDIDIPIDLLGFEDGAIPEGKENLFIRDKREGLDYYRRVADLKIEDDGFFGGHVGGVAAPLSPKRKNVKIKAPKVPKSKSDKIKSKLKALPSFWPYFTIFIIVLDIIAASAPIIIEWASNGNLAPIHLIPLSITYNPQDYLTLNNVSRVPNVSVYAGDSPNMWIGTSVEFLITAGASYAPCMRRDQQIVARYAEEDERKVALGGLGCCRNDFSAGTVLRSECGGAFTPNVPCSSPNFTLPIPVTQVFRPCCIGIMGRCQVVTSLHCSFLGGIFHPNSDSCATVNCFRAICGMFGTGINSVPGFENRPDPSQWWRWITALFFHAGIIHLIVVAVETLIVAGLVEHTAGLIRVALIYFICGIGGNMFGSIISPYAIQLGGSPAVMGLSAVFLVEYFETVQALKNKCVEFLRLLGVLVTIFLVNFILGTFPYVDNWANLGGFLFGIPSALVFLPYVTFGKWDAVRKRIVLAVALPILIFMFLVLLIIFYVANTDFCSVCKYFSCIPYYLDVCGNAYNYPDPQVVYSS